MPFNYDFSKIENTKEINVNPVGWLDNIIIEYGTYEDVKIYGGMISYFWRVKGTFHTFVIPISRLDYISAGDYKRHFEESLESFREDYLIWKEDGFKTDWSKEYHKQYSSMIIL